MRINNKIVSESFSVSESGNNISDNIEALRAISSLIEFCSQIGDIISYDDELFYQVVDNDGTIFADWLYGNTSGLEKDAIDYFSSLLRQKCTKEHDGDTTIEIGLPCNTKYVGRFEEYKQERCSIMEKLVDKSEFVDMAQKSFPNLLFSNTCFVNMKKEMVGDTTVRRQMVKILAFLDKDQGNTYRSCNNDIELSLRSMESLVGITCATDPKHKDDLMFDFTIQNSNAVATKKICCHIHFKILRDDSNYRLYFWWNDEKLDNKGKIPIGYIDGHPY